MVESWCRPGSTTTMPETPPYKRIQTDLQRRIDAGEWQPGDRLPTQQELADQYGVSLQPIKNALTRLAIAGVITQRMGGRAIVAGTAQDRLNE
jgi:DNA-binding GntR family transcriptional regulator